MIKDYGNQILDLLLARLPYTPAVTEGETAIGTVYNVESFEIQGNKMLLSVSSVDYDFIKLKFGTSFGISANIFTISGFKLKNTIVKFEHFVSSAFKVKFKKNHNLKVEQEIELKGFVNTSYNTTYKVIQTISSNEVLLANDTIPQNTLTSGFGSLTVGYIGGLNSVYRLTDEGANKAGFIINDNSLSTFDINDIEINALPKIYYFYETVKCTSILEFCKNNSDAKTTLIIDTQSLSIKPYKSKGNETDSDYDTYGRTGDLKRNYSMDLFVVQDKNTKSSSVVGMQSKFDNIFLSILREPLKAEGATTSSITIGSVDFVDISIEFGRKVIQYSLSWSVHYMPTSNLLDIGYESNPINIVQANNDEIIW